MADISIDATIDASLGTARALRKDVSVTPDIGYQVFFDGDRDLVYSKTTDGGETWGAAVQIGIDQSGCALDVWFDQWTPGDSGTLIHIWSFGTTAIVSYQTLDIADDTIGTQRTVFTGVTQATGRGNFVSGTKTKSGKLRCAFDIDAGVEKGLYGSTDGGTTWGLLSEPFVEETLDQCLLFPASGTGDDDDHWGIYQDASTNELTRKTWDFSGAVATESTAVPHIDAGTDGLGQMGFSATVRHSDGKLIVVAVSQRLSATADHQVWVVDESGFTELTAIATDKNNHYHPQVFIDQLTDHIYDVYNGKSDGTETLDTATKVYYRPSRDGGVTWEPEMPYMEGAAGVVAQVWVPLMGPRFCASWRIGSTLVGNAVNSLDLGGGAPTPISEDNYSFPMQVTAQKRFVTVFA